MSKRETPVAVYDFTGSSEKIEFTVLRDALIKHCKKWTFQKEEGSKTGFLHYQGRVSLKVKNRLSGVINLFKEIPMRWSITSTENRDNCFYVLKDDTRVEGPWSDSDEVIYIPRQIRDIDNLYPWQEKIIKISKKWDTRTIHCIIDLEGNNGKTSLMTYMMVHKLGEIIPFCNDYRDIMRFVMDMPTSNCYLIDMPRAINKEKLFQMWSGIETVKNGYAFDDRYHFRRKIFDCPQIFVFMNTPPNKNLLSRDRWKLWTIEDYHLVKYKEDTPDFI